ncbi:MAG: hypothetical protein WAM82_35500 [Thermoanaerobaculia bacterium]
MSNAPAYPKWLIEKALVPWKMSTSGTPEKIARVDGIESHRRPFFALAEDFSCPD